MKSIFAVLQLIGSLILCSTNALAWSPEVGELPKDIQSYEYVDGTPIVWGDLKGKPTIVYFGGDWCPPCLETRPTVLKIAKTKADKINVVFITSDDNKLRAKKLEEAQVDNLHIAMPKLSKYPANTTSRGTREMGDFGRIYVWPTAVLINKEGLVVQKYERSSVIKVNIESDASKLQ